MKLNRYLPALIRSLMHPLPFVLRLSAWQIFLFNFILPFVVGLSIPFLYTMEGNLFGIENTLLEYPIITILILTVSYLINIRWIQRATIRVHSTLNVDSGVSLKWFNIACNSALLIYLVAVFVRYNPMIIEKILDPSYGTQDPENGVYSGLINVKPFPITENLLYIFKMVQWVLLIWIANTMAKVFNRAKYQNSKLHIGATGKTLLGVFFFIGVWYLVPEFNRLIEKNDDSLLSEIHE